MIKKLLLFTLLVSAFASLCAADTNEKLARAVKSNDARQVKKLITTLSDVDMLIEFNVLDFMEGMEHSTKGTLLMWASYHGYLEIADLLIKKGADVNKKGETGWTALMSACRMGHPKITQLLIRYGAEVNESDEYSFTPLMYAVMQGDIDSVNLLVEHHASLDARADNGFTALMFACYNHKDIAEYLLARGSDLSLEGGNGWNALYVAAVSGKYEIVKLLLEHGAQMDKVYQCANCGQTILIVAAQEGFADIARLLLKNGAHMNLKDDWGYTALDWAERKNHADIAALLKDAGALHGNELRNK